MCFKFAHQLHMRARAHTHTHTHTHEIWLWNSWNDFITIIPVFLHLTDRCHLWSTPLEQLCI